jgi:hypothetical protein
MKHFGEITLTSDKRLLIDAEPHVMVRVRPLFNGAVSHPIQGKYTHRPISISFTQSNSKDLLWINERYPLLIPMQLYAEIKTKSQEYDRILTEVSKADNNKNFKVSPHALKLSLPLREHQIKFYNMFMKVKKMLLADKLGLGKTSSAIGILSEPHMRPAIIIVPPHLCSQWGQELLRFLPDLKIHTIKGFKNYKLPTDVDVILTTYNRLAPWEDTLGSLHFSTVIMDEVHELRHEGTAKRELCKILCKKAQYCLGLSGTPIYNKGSEMYSVMDVISDNCLGSREEFIREWCDWDSVKEPTILHSFLKSKGLMLRRTPDEVGLVFGKGEPSKIVYTLDSDIGSLNAIKEVTKNLALSVLSGNVGESDTSAREFDFKLRQATGIAKAKSVAEFVRMILSEEEKVVIAGWHRECFARGTLVMKSDGTSEKVENIQIGDLVMGPDSKPRLVKELTKGFGKMFKIIPKKGAPWVCSENHILTMSYCPRKKRKTVHIPASEFFKMKKRRQERYTLMRADSVLFETNKPVFEPWLLGYWLGNGSSDLHGFRVSSAEPEVLEKMTVMGEKYNLNVKTWNNKGASGHSKCLQIGLSGDKNALKKSNLVLNKFRDLNLTKNKHIPHEYKTASIEQRRELLAGLLDSDGHVYRNGCGASFSNINLTLIEDVAWLCRSLGLAAYVCKKKNNVKISSYTRKDGKSSDVYDVSISGDLTEIPLLVNRKKERALRKRVINKSVLRVGLSIESLGNDDYFGFEVDQDNLFLLNDFTVVHNCYNILMEDLKEFKPVLYTGTENQKQKDESKKAFMEGDSRVFIISLRSGAGLDGLQRVCNTVVFAELDWSPHVMDQVIGRLHRDGQVKHVRSFYLTVADGSDPIMMAILNVKRAQHDGIIEGQEIGVEVLDDNGGGATKERVIEMAKKYLESIGEEIPEAVPEVGLLGDIANALRKFKISTNTEADMQLGIFENLPQMLPNAKVEREHYFTKRSRIDFLISNSNERIGVECNNVATKKASVYAQVRRYVEEGNISGLILIAPWHGVSSFKVDGVPVIVIDTNLTVV